MEGSFAVWTMFALMTAAAVMAVLLPLARARAADGGSDLAVYRDQLDEIGRDRDAGVIGAAEAEAARIEVSRRIIAAAERGGATAPEGAGGRRRVAALAALVAVPLVAIAGYGLRGQPGYPGQPLAERRQQAPGQNDIATLIARIEAHLAANPEDGRGWEVVAPVYLRLGRAGEAVRARANALRLLGATADREADLAEAQVAAAGGVVTAEAKAGLERAIARSADHPKAGYLLGLSAEQDGRPAEARAIWSRLIDIAPPNAPWLGVLRSEVARLGPADAPRPTASDIRGMVDGLAARLAADGSDFDGWLRLVRSYSVLGEADKARAAAASVRQRFAAEADKIGQLDALMRELGMGG
ncbi:MAG: c-type cytochrome biogenesis protein CcmI [Phreatobacter sp.]|uniref:c-type cytochrome biogenesis protein CcmI n=1 Tax=Phreatobacter sp. TaxID=1966341 RepID=UPI001A6144F9|nr:c-type cytochrome biogenesis protein CcmI [Phreatobacter sp.]MBL8568707.1 c-type cytochrome biogenesis protein CcmI [Phreatobacter sp.]